MNPMNYAWVMLKQGGGPVMPHNMPPQGGPQSQGMGQVQPGIEASTQPHAYKPDQLMAIAHNLANDLLQRLQQVADDSPHWAGIMHDAKRIQDLLERAMSGNKPEEQDEPEEPGVGGGVGV
jgi:hypothetical protein